MGIFLIFFPEEKQHFNYSILKRTNSNSNHILFTKTQSTISLCALLIFLTFLLLLFTQLSSFEPNTDFIKSHRRFLTRNSNSPNFALQGLGTLYTRGTSATDELVICHVPPSVTTDDLKLFVRTFHRSGLPSKSDLLFVFDSISTIGSFDYVIREEIDAFLKLVIRYKENIGNGSEKVDFPAGFDPTRFVKSGQDSNKGEPIWGRRGNSSLGDDSTELTRLSYGSVVGFGIGELDPENSLSGFLDRVPMGLRRWASYPMLLGRVRRKFKRVMLVDVSKILLLGDPFGFGRVKSHSAESVILSLTPEKKQGRKVNKSSRKVVDPSLILGGERCVRRLSAAMLTEIVRSTARQYHKQNSLAESTLLSQLVANEFLQKSIRFTLLTESIPGPSQLSGVGLANMTVVRRGNSNSNLDIGLVIMKHICSFPIDSSVYTEC